MDKIIEGVLKFGHEVFPAYTKLFDKLASGQEPEVLMITCADSRVDPALFTQSRPGDLFVCRNAGNIVPPWGRSDESNTASIEYAVKVLGVSEIVVCGHSDCGAMKGALNPDSLDALPKVAGWLEHSRAAVDAARKRNPQLSDTALLQTATEENVLLQLQHLRTHPSVAAALASGKLRLHGWVYDIGSGRILAHDPEAGRFEPLEGARDAA